MVAYWAIIILTVLILTYITYKVSSLWDFDFSPKTLIICGFFACILGLLIPQVVAYATNITMWLIALFSLVVLSSYALSISTDDNMARETREPSNSITAFYKEIPDDTTSGNEIVKEEAATIIPAIKDNNEDRSEIADSPAVVEFSKLTASVDDEGLFATDISEPDNLEDGTAVVDNPEDRTEIADSPAVVEFSKLTASVDDEGLFATDISEPDNLEDRTAVVDNPEGRSEIADRLVVVEVGKFTPSDDSGELKMIEHTNTEKDPFSITSDDHDIAYYLDLGFAAKTSGNYAAAISAFQKAIDTELDNPAILYIITEICTLLKLQGCYEEAIQQMQKGRDLATTFQDHAMASEFVAGIAYLRALKETSKLNNL